MINEGCFHCFVFTVNKNLQKKSFHENAHVLDSNSCTNFEGSAGSLALKQREGNRLYLSCRKLV